MEKTPFAGLTRLTPSENIDTDGSSLQWQNPRITDHFLEVGAVTHRHDAHAALEDPSLAASASVSPNGGTIPAGLDVYLGYTLTDSDDGETIISPVTAVTTDEPLDPPGTPPVASADYSAGQLPYNTYYYALTLIDGDGGETPPTPPTAVDRSPGYASGRILLSGLSVDMVLASAVGWRLYRAIAGGTFDLLAQGSGDAFTDDGTTGADCSTHPPQDFQNTTHNTNEITVTVPSGSLSSAVSFSIYASLDGTFTSPALLGNYPVSSANQPITYTALDLLDGEPPDVSTCIRGANQIDPDTDILDWHWKRPVSTYGALGSGDTSDVRVTLDRGEAWVVGGASAGVPADWRPLLPLRNTASATTGALASGASATASVALSDSYRLMKVGADRSCRIRVYATLAHRTADLARGLGVAPTGDHGCLLDQVLLAGTLALVTVPQVDGSDLDEPADGNIPVTITNLSATSAVTVSLKYLVTE